MAGKFRKLSGVLLVTAVLSALPITAQAASTTISITVPATQRLEGMTSLIVSAGAPVQTGRLTIKSNIAWVLVAQATGATAQVTYRVVGDSPWQSLGARTPVLQGVKGVHEVAYEVRGAPQGGAPATVIFSIEPVAVQ